MDKLFFRIIFPVWVILIVLNFANPKQEFSESENRYLSKFPDFSVETLINGKFMEKVDEYFNDHFVGRDNWMSMQNGLEYTIGKRENNSVYLCKNALMANLEFPDKGAVKGNIEGIKAFAQEYDMPCYLMLVPSAAAVQTDKLPLFAQIWDQQEFITQVGQQLEGEVNSVAVFDTLHENRNEYIYYRTDHHWTTDGAFLAYDQLCEAMNLPKKTKDDFKITAVTDSFEGTLASKTGANAITPDSIKTYQIGTVKSYSVFDGKKTTEYPSIYFDDYLAKKDKYSYFLGPNQPIVTIHTEAPSGKKLLIFKDSYAHSFAPFLLEDYSEISLVDMRYINDRLEKFIDPTAFDDVLFLYSTDVFAQQKLLSKLK